VATAGSRRSTYSTKDFQDFNMISIQRKRYDHVITAT
jgi:hypothetical protein